MNAQNNENKMCIFISGIPPPTIEWTRLGGALLPIGKEKHYVSKRQNHILMKKNKRTPYDKDKSN